MSYAIAQSSLLTIYELVTDPDRIYSTYSVPEKIPGNDNIFVSPRDPEASIEILSFPGDTRVEDILIGAEEMKNFIDNGPIKNILSEGIFEKIYFDTANGTVVVDSTGTSIR